MSKIIKREVEVSRMSIRTKIIGIEIEVPENASNEEIDALIKDQALDEAGNTDFNEVRETESKYMVL